MRVDFYLLNGGDQRRELFACKLSEKAWGQQQHVYIHTESEKHAEELDSLLWTFREGSFLPHNIVGRPVTNGAKVPVLIGWKDPGILDNYPVLINLNPSVPAFYSHFERVAEIVNQSESVKTEGRERFAFYREQGCNLHHHNL